MPNESLNFSQQQQQSNDNFLKAFFTSANEHSKRLTVVDTIIYVIFIAALIALTAVKVELAEPYVKIVSYLTTAYVALRATYGIKSGLENYKKISSSFNEARLGIDEDDEEDG